MRNAEPRSPAIGNMPVGFQDISPLDELVMVRARRQRAHELAMIARLAASGIASRVAAIYRWLTRPKSTSRRFG